ncbi:DUF3999 family protein [Paenibacillus sp. sgz500958]|uniref:DUF3999 family protein n=1 Tax=Paenibacillus sp. sgz500958 TaxID=3242475 RepID=UPI0036D2F4DE
MAGQRAIRNIKVITVALCLFLGLNSPNSRASAPDQSLELWKFSKPLQTEASGKYHELYLDEEVYAKAAGDLRDLRIADSGGGFVPFFIESGREAAVEQNIIYAATQVHKEKKQQETLIDYAVTPLQLNTDIQGNKLIFTLPGESFLKHVQVFGSYDGITWEDLIKDDLYRTGGVEKNSVELGAIYKYGYYRLSVKNNVEDLDFPSLQLLHRTSEVKSTDFKRAGTPQYEVKEEPGLTRIVINNGDRLKVTKVSVGSGGNFSRRYEVRDESGSNIAVEGNGELYRLDFKDVQITGTDIVALEPISSPSFTITVSNGDDTPLEITNVRTEYLVDKLVFAETGQGPYRLLYGNSAASTPQYDIVKFRTQIAGEEVAAAKLGAEFAAATPEPKPKSGPVSGKVVFNILIVAVSLLLVTLLIRKMKKD